MIYLAGLVISGDIRLVISGCEEAASSETILSKQNRHTGEVKGVRKGTANFRLWCCL